MRKSIACLGLALSIPGAVSAQSVNYQSQLLLDEIVLNISGSGSYTQKGKIVYLSGQMVSDAVNAPSMMPSDRRMLTQLRSQWLCGG